MKRRISRFGLIFITLSIFSVVNCAKKMNKEALSIANLSQNSGTMKPSVSTTGISTVTDGLLEVELDDSIGVVVKNISKKGMVCTEVVGQDDGLCDTLLGFSNLETLDPSFSGQAWQYIGGDDQGGAYSTQIPPQDIYLNAGKTLKRYFYDPKTQLYSDPISFKMASLNGDGRPVMKAFGKNGILIREFGQGGYYSGSEVAFNCGESCMGCTFDHSRPNHCVDDSGAPKVENFVVLGSEASALKHTGNNYKVGPLDTRLIQYESEDYHPDWSGLTISHYVYSPSTGKVSQPLVLYIH